MKSCNRKILELFYNAKHTGRITKPDAIGRVGEDDDGLVIEITWRVIGGVIAEAKFRAFANPNAIAITSLMIDNIIGKTVDEAIVIGENVIIDNLGEFRPEYLEVYDMVRECIADAYNNYLKRQSRKTDEVEQFDYETYIATHEIEDGEEIDVEQIQRQLQIADINTEKRGRGRPRKPVDPNAIVEVGEKRGRGRPRKERPEVDETIEVVKRGRGRPRKERPEGEIVEIGEKRGRGRPRKPVDPNAVVEVGEKRGRGRPRKIVDESEIVEPAEKRGRGRPRKEVDPNAVVEVGEKRGRGRPRKPVDPNAIVEVGEKRGRGRPRKEEVKYNLPTDLDEVVEDEEFEQLINGNNHADKEEFIDNLTSGKLLDEDDETFEEDYDLFKSNIRNIFTGKEVSNQNYGQARVETREESRLQASTIEQVEELEDDELENDEVVNEVTEISEVKRGRGRPRKEVDPNEVVEVGEKRGRGRPRKIVDESEIVEPAEKRGRGRPRKVVEETTQTQQNVKSVEAPVYKTVNSLTRTLSPNGLPPHSTQEIVFASKNVTTTNINVTKTSINIDEDNKVVDYSDINISSVKHEIKELPKTDKNEPEIEEVEIEPVKPISQNTFKDFDDDDFDDENDFDDEDAEGFDDEDYNDENIKDEAPKGGIEDLLKALLDD